MKLLKTETISFKKGQSYLIEDTIGYPQEYFRKPINDKEDPSRKFSAESLSNGQADDLSDFDVCVKSFKIVRKWYE